MQGLYAYRGAGTAQGILYDVQVKLDASHRVFCKAGGMSYRLKKGPLFMNKDVFKCDAINKWIVDHIHPYVLGQIVFLHTDHAVFLQKTIFFCITECIAAMPAFHRAIVCMGIEVDAIDLGKWNSICFMPAFGCAFDERISIIMPASYYNRKFFRF